MNTQVLELNDQDLQAIHGGGTTAAVTDAVIGVLPVPGLGAVNNIASLAGFSIGNLFESLF